MILGRLALAVAAFGALTVSAGAAPRAAPNLPAAKAFVAAVYARYPSTDGNPPLFDIPPADAGLIDPSLLALIREDQRLAGDYEGAMAYDPFCHCTHDNGMVATIGEPVGGPAGQVVVPVVVALALPDQPASTVQLKIHTVSNRGKVQVYDVDTDGAGLRAFLVAANHKRHGRR